MNQNHHKKIMMKNSTISNPAGDLLNIYVNLQ